MNNNNNIDRLFFKCFRNKFILKNILYHLNIYNLVYYSLISGSISEEPFSFNNESLKRFKYRSYLTEIIIGPPGLNNYIKKELFYHKESCYKYNISCQDDIDNKDSYYYFSIKEDDYSNDNLKSCGTHQIIKKEEEEENKSRVKQDNDKKRKLNDQEEGINYICNCFPFLENSESLYQQFDKKNELYKISKGLIPYSCETLYLNISNKIIEPDMITSSVKNLMINSSVYPDSSNLIQGSIPTSVELMKFENQYNKELKPNVLPSSIKYLEFGMNYNKEIKPNVIPSSCESIILGYSFNQSISIPPSCKSLTFGFKFNQDISNSILLLNNLKYLEFGDSFINNNNLKLLLPNSIEILKFGWDFNLPIQKLPNNIKHLVFCGTYNQPLPESLFINTPYLESIELPNKFNQSTLSIPKHVKIIKKNRVSGV